jgi:hypothetical protein
MKYVVEQKYYNSGRVVANIIETENPEKFESYNSTSACDIYNDTFDTMTEALKFRNDALKA